MSILTGSSKVNDTNSWHNCSTFRNQQIHKEASHKKSGVRKLVTVHAIDAVRMNQESKNKEKCQPQREPQPFLDLMIIFTFALL